MMMPSIDALRTGFSAGYAQWRRFWPPPIPNASAGPVYLRDKPCRQAPQAAERARAFLLGIAGREL
jgi:hypothetical protein